MIRRTLLLVALVLLVVGVWRFSVRDYRCSGNVSGNLC